jgi:hypothetical protein
MPATSKKQYKFIWALRNKYGSKKKAPKKYHWVFDDEWTDVDYQELPQKVSETRVMKFDEWSGQI